MVRMANFHRFIQNQNHQISIQSYLVCNLFICQLIWLFYKILSFYLDRIPFSYSISLNVHNPQYNVQTHISAHLTVLETLKTLRMLNNRRINHVHISYMRKPATLLHDKESHFPASPEKLAHWHEWMFHNVFLSMLESFTWSFKHPATFQWLST